MVVVDIQVPLTGKVQIPSGMKRQGAEHVVKKAKARTDLDHPTAIKGKR
jgi:hypothetical protein